MQSKMSAHLVGLCLPELIRSLLDADGGALDVFPDGVHHAALLVHHCGQVIEDGVHVDDARLKEGGKRYKSALYRNLIIIIMFS
jgi:hypothetical protein